MKHLITSLIAFCIFFSAHAQSVSVATVYKHFASTGTTAGLWHTFHHPADGGGTADTTDINIPLVLAPADFQQLLATAKKHKHSPSKIEGIRFAGMMVIAGEQHFYVYCGPTLFIDLTAKLNYELAATAASSFDAKATQLPHQD